MKSSIICPFDIERLTGTPLRAKVDVTAVSKFADLQVVSAKGESLTVFTRRALGELRRFRPDVLQCITTLSLIPALLYKGLYHPGVKIIFELHGWAWYETKGKLPFQKRIAFLALDRIGLWCASVAIAVSHTERKFLADKVLRKSKVVTVWDPVDFLLEYQEPSQREFLKVGYIGNAERWQGLPAVIDAARLLEKDERIRFVLAGFDASDEMRFPKLKNITYLRRVERPDVPSFLQDCDILVSSRLMEKVSDLQFPHKLSEYLAVGRPVIVSGASDQPFVVAESKAGFILPEVSGNAIAAALREFAALSNEEKIRMGKNAREFCKNNLYQDVFAGKLKAVYDSLHI